MSTTDLAKRDEVMKTLWKRPEGVFGTITGIGLIAAIGYGIYKILPFLVAMAANLIGLIVECLVLGLLLFMIFNKDTWRNLSLIWYQINRKILGWIVDLDPISVLKRAIGEMREKLQIIDEKVIELDSINISMQKKLEEYKKDFDYNTRLKKQIETKLAKEQDENEKFRYKNELVNVNNAIVRGRNQIVKQQDRIKMSVHYHKMMQRLAVAAKYKVQDAENDLYYKEEEFNQAKASRSAMKTMMDIFRGGMSKTLEQEMALATVNDTINKSLADMKSLIDGSNDILTKFELDSDINADKAEELLKLYETNGFAIFEKTDDMNVTSDIFASKAISDQPATVHEAQFVEVPVEKVEEKKESRYF